MSASTPHQQELGRLVRDDERRVNGGRLGQPQQPVALVAYASRNGSTAEAAAIVCDRLRAGGWRVQLRQAREVRDLDDVDAVILGGALYAGRWHRDARRFLRHHRRELGELPLAVFALGPRTLDPDDVASSRRQLTRALEAAPEVVPVSIEIFGGVLVPERLPFPLNRMPASDACDRDAVAAWGDELARYVSPARRASAPT